jgi:multidrug efflux pump subunit AcrB
LKKVADPERKRLAGALAKVEDLEGLVVAEKDDLKVLLRDVAAVQVSADRGGGGGVALRPDKAGAETAAVLLVVRPTPRGASDLPRALDKVFAEAALQLNRGRLEWHVFRPGDPTVFLRPTPGSPPFRRAEAARAAAEAALRVPQVKAAFWLPGADEEEVTLFLSLAGDADPRPGLRTELAKIEGATARVGALRSPTSPWPGEGMQVVARVHGTDPEEVRAAAGRLRERLAKVKGVVDLYQAPSVRPRLMVEVDRRKCQQLGLQVADVYRILSLGFSGFEVDELKSPEKTVVLTFAERHRLQTDDLLSLNVQAGDGKMVRLRDVAKAHWDDAATAVFREDGRFCLVVACNAEGRGVAEVREEARNLARGLALKTAKVDLDE